MIYYAIAVGVVITLVIIRQLPRSEKAAGETQNSNATTRNISKSKSNSKTPPSTQDGTAVQSMRGTSLAIHEALSKDDIDTGEDDSLDLDEWKGRRENVRCACDAFVLLGLFAAIVYVLIQDYRYDLIGYLKKALPRETALVTNIVSGVRQAFDDIHERFFQDEL
jgi:hypothetical protein